MRERFRATAVGCALAAMVLAAGVATAAESGTQAPEGEVPRCHGRRATIVGTEGPDVLEGTPGRDVIWGGGGDDRIYGNLGNDLICGGPGSDLIHGGRGNDVADGGPGDRDRVIGDLGDDILMGGPGNEDEVAGSLGIDTINGGPGNGDIVHGDYGNDRMDGGPGSGDIASFATDVASSKGAGVRADIKTHSARGDGHDRLYRVEGLEGSAFRDVLIGGPRTSVIRGGPGDDTLLGKRATVLEGGQGTDGCKGGAAHVSCGKEAAPKGSAFVQLDPAPGGGGGLQIVGGGGNDNLRISLDEEDETFTVTAAKGLAVGEGCGHASGNLAQAVCPANGPPRWLTADLGPGNDKLKVEGSLEGAQNVRLAGGPGDDEIHGGPEDDLIEAGPGADKLYGEGGADGLVGGLPGPTFLYGGAEGDLLAAGGGCAGGALVGGPGRDDASFAETQAHPGTLIISFPLNKAWINAVPGCHPVRLANSDEDMEGSFDNDILIGDRRANSMLGQPGKDRFYGNGGEDVIDARDGFRDFSIQCGRSRPEGRALTDTIDPPTTDCAQTTHGSPVPGLNHKE